MVDVDFRGVYRRLNKEWLLKNLRKGRKRKQCDLGPVKSKTRLNMFSLPEAERIRCYNALTTELLDIFSSIPLFDAVSNESHEAGETLAQMMG